MGRSIISISSIFFNGGVIVLILGGALHRNLDLDTISAWLFISLALLIPVINISNLVSQTEFMKPWIALVSNSLVLLIFSFIILFVMVWPMGSKPNGGELLSIFSLYSVLLFTELALILEMKKHEMKRGGSFLPGRAGLGQLSMSFTSSSKAGTI